MNIRPFSLERYFARYEFGARHLLSASDCDGPSLPQLLALADDECRTRWANLSLGYTESAGLPALRDEIATLYGSGSPGCSLTPEQVLTVVPEEGVLLIMLALVRPGDRVICTYPGYQSLYEVASALGAEVVPWTPREEQAWEFSPEDLAALLQAGARLVVCNFPHNPTGSLPDGDDFRRMVEMSEEAGAFVFSDEMYRWLDLPGHDTLPSAVELSAHAVALGGLSKSFGLAGLRTGWLAARSEEVLTACTRLKDYTTICAAAPSEILALVALRARNTLLSTHRKRVAANAVLLGEFAATHPQLFSLTPPAGGTVCFPRLLRPEGAEAFCARLVRESGVMMLPSTVYEYGDAHVRLGLGRSDFPQALQELARFLSLEASAAP
ncbi:MAG: aminotransferase class I/II-fold pyridoxal phosphate-dependent enzyme [Gaiellales bacterium]|nr:aminotransferase class I/II-fold pyridoxal phosphate-dependent enzyme [Gaiellales bacterium]